MTVIIPHRADDSVIPEQLLVLPDLVVLQVHSRSRIVWRELQPCLFSESKITRQRLLQCILRHTQVSCGHKKTILSSKDEDDDEAEITPIVDPHGGLYYRHCYKVRLPSQQDTQRRHNHLILWIQPPTRGTPIETVWEGRLIQWEHHLLQASSLAAYFATLGGGFFLCRHLKTALQLAVQQQRMAVLLGDTGMYYRCLVNQAYNYIYAGYFRAARRILKQVQEAASSPQSISDKEVLVQMCQSAVLFCRRVRKARQTPVTEQSALVKDDLYRIRMVQDQSLASTDVTAPFRRRT